MKNILIISYYHQNIDTIGYVRMNNLIEGLKNVYNITILSSNQNSKIYEKNMNNVRLISINDNNIYNNIRNKKYINIKISKTNNKIKSHILNKLIFIYNEIFFIPDGSKNWIKPSIKYINKDIKNNYKYDLIISSAPPVSSHIVAYKISKKYNIPWIADYRDMWNDNPYEEHYKIRKYYEKYLENKVLKQSKYITTISKGCKKYLENKFKDKEIYTIYTGYNTDNNNTDNNNMKKRKLSIVYTGGLYKGKRDPTMLFKVLSKLNNNNEIDIDKFNITFYGPDLGWLNKLIRKYKISKIVHVHDVISRKKSLKIQKNSQILLLLTWDCSYEKGVIPGKVFDYISAKRPVLSLGSNNSEGLKILEKINVATHCNNEEELEKYLISIYKEYIEKNYISYNGNSKLIKHYSSIHMVNKFNNIILKCKI